MERISTARLGATEKSSSSSTMGLLLLEDGKDRSKGFCCCPEDAASAGIESGGGGGGTETWATGGGGGGGDLGVSGLVVDVPLPPPRAAFLIPTSILGCGLGTKESEDGGARYVDLLCDDLLPPVGEFLCLFGDAGPRSLYFCFLPVGDAN